MSESSEKIKQFNGILGDFIKDIIPLVGSSYYHYFENLIKYNAQLPMELFLAYALPLRDKIINRDETYFENNDNHTSMIGDREYVMCEILRLQNIYRKLDEESRSNVWDYFQAMLILGEEYIRLNYNKYNKSK